MKQILLIPFFFFQAAYADQNDCPTLDGTYAGDDGAQAVVQIKKTSPAPTFVITAHLPGEDGPVTMTIPLDGKTEVGWPNAEPGTPVSEARIVGFCETGKLILVASSMGFEIVRGEAVPTEGGLTFTHISSVEFLNQGPQFYKRIK